VVKMGRIEIWFLVLIGPLVAAGPLWGRTPDPHDPPTEPPVFKASALDTFAYVDQVTDANLLGLNITNYGFFGNDFVTRDPSMEYPLGSQVDHLIRAGIWIGAEEPEFGDTLVTTATVDGYWRTGGSSVTEFTPRTQFIRELSSLIFRNTYHPQAVSEQDFLAVYDDLDLKPRPGVEQHRPLGLKVLQRSYVWSYEYTSAFVIVSFDIINVSGGTLSNVYVGMYSELASGNKGRYNTWPPSGWFHQKILHYDEERRLLAEHQTYFGGGWAPYWGAIKYLGSTPDSDEPPEGRAPVAFNWWQWAPGNTQRDEDRERYRILANGEIDDVSTVGLEGTDDPVELISVGPFRSLAPDDTLQVVFAFIGGRSLDHIRASGAICQEAYDKDYRIPGPPPSPLLYVRPGENLLEICWDDSVEALPDPSDSTVFDFEGYRIYVTRTEGADLEDFSLVREFDIAGDGYAYETGLADVRLAPEDRFVVGGVEYDYCYVLANLKDGFKYWISVTSFDTGDEEKEIVSLESGVKQNLTMAIPGSRRAAGPNHVTVFPNPYHGDAVWNGSLERDTYLWFANLPERALIRIYSLSGDLIDEIEFDGETYDAGNLTGIENRTGENLAFSGGMCAWDLISRNDQPIASGLYLFTVSDRKTGEVFVGKFMVVR